MKKKLIEVQSLRYSIGDRVILRDITLDIYQHELLLLTGANGSGKSSLLRILAGLVAPERGVIRIASRAMERVTPVFLEERGITLGFVFQQRSLISNLSVFENIALPFRYHNRLSESEIEKKVNKILKEVEIAEYKDLRPSFLSAGIYKCVSIARAFVTKPNVILFDDPTSELDALFSERILSLIQRFHKEYQATSVIATHAAKLPVSIADRKLLIQEGRIFSLE